VQFVFPAEAGRDRIVRPVRGVSRSAFNILDSARRAGRSHARLLESELEEIDWNVVEFTYSKSSMLSLEEERKVPANIVWNRELLASGGISEVLVVEHDGADFWCRDMMRRATEQKLRVRQFSTRSWVPGAARAVGVR
jgi:squalene cyclase